MIYPARLRIPLLFLLGFLYVFLTPIFEAPDEPAHFARAYGIAEGQFILRDHSKALALFIRHQFKAMDSPETRSMAEYLKRYEQISTEERVPNIAYNTALYSPVPYLTHAAVIKTIMLCNPQGDVFRLQAYLCRIFSLLIFCSMLVLSFHICPGFKFWLEGLWWTMFKISSNLKFFQTLPAKINIVSLFFSKFSKTCFFSCLKFVTLIQV